MNNDLREALAKIVVMQKEIEEMISMMGDSSSVQILKAAGFDDAIKIAKAALAAWSELP